MKPLIVLLAVFAISLVVTRISSGRFEYAQSGRIALSVMLVFTAIAHFVFTQGMALMIPAFIPFRTPIVYLTGILEIATAVGLLVPSLRSLTGCLLIAFFILILPANIYAAIKQVDYQTATFNGKGLAYLWFRIPLQFVYIAWAYWASRKS